MIGLALPWAWIALGISIPLVGTVEDDAGRPIAGAAVILGDTHRDGLDHEPLGAARTDAAGRFRLDRPDNLAGRGRSWSPTIWVFVPGRRLAFRELSYHIPTPAEPVRFVLEPLAPAAVRVLLPDGRPAAGARVRPTVTLLKAPQPPSNLADLLGGTADAAGRADLAGLRVEELFRVEVTAPGLVSQDLPVTSGTEGVVARLRPVGRLEVRLATTEPAALRGWQITATSSPTEGTGWNPPTSWVRSTTDPLGVADLRPLAAGRITWRVEAPAGSPYLAEDPPGVLVRPDQVTEVSIPLRRAVRVSGAVRLAGGGAPVAGIKVYTRCRSANLTTDDPTTDAAGRFSYLTLAGPNEVDVRTFLPDAYLVPHGQDSVVAFPVPAGPDLALPPIELLRAGRVEGRVVDQAGQPVEGATFVGSWRAAESPQARRNVQGETFEGGRFAVGKLPPGADLTLTTEAGDRADPATITVRAGDPAGPVAPVEIRLAFRPTYAIAGRVLRPDGRPAAGAKVGVTLRSPTQNFPRGVFSRFDPAGATTGADGTFQTAADIPAGLLTLVRAEAPGFSFGESPYRLPDDRAPVEIRLLPLDQPRAVAGRVVDPQGAPVAEVEVFQAGDGPRRTSGRSDAEGRFEVPDVSSGPAFLLARSPDHRLTGRVVAPADRDVTIVVTRRDQPPPRRLVASPSPPRPDDRAWALELLEPAWQDHLNGVQPPNSHTSSVLDLMARLDPPRVTGMIRNQTIDATPALLANLVMWRVAAADPARPLAILDAVDPPYDLASAALNVFDTWRTIRPELSEPILALAERQARREAIPRFRRPLLVALAGSWYVVGQVERGRALAREAEAIPFHPDDPQHPFGTDFLPYVLAQVDPPAALRLVAAGPADRNLDTIRVGVAQRIAATHPADAVRLVGQVPNRDGLRLGDPVVIALARAGHLAEAHALAASSKTDPITLALLPALRADRLRSTDQAEARALLAESFARLGDLAAAEPRDQDRRGFWPVTALALLLPLAARVDPDRADEYLWTVVAARPAHPFELERSGPNRPWLNPAERQQYVNLMAVALLVAPLDRAVGEALFAPALDRVPPLDNPHEGLGREPDRLFRLAAAFDPAAARALGDALPPDPTPLPPTAAGYGLGTHHARADARFAIAAALSFPPALRAREALRAIEDAPWLDKLAP